MSLQCPPDVPEGARPEALRPRGLGTLNVEAAFGRVARRAAGPFGMPAGFASFERGRRIVVGGRSGTAPDAGSGESARAPAALPEVA